MDHRKKLILAYVLSRGLCWATTQRQISDTGIPQSSFYKLRAELVRDGWIEKLQYHPDAPEGCHEIYRARPDRWNSIHEKVFSPREISHPEKNISSPENNFSLPENPYKECKREIEIEREKEERGRHPPTRCGPLLLSAQELLTPATYAVGQACGLDRAQTECAVQKLVEYSAANEIRKHDWHAYTQYWLRHELSFLSDRRIHEQRYPGRVSSPDTRQHDNLADFEELTTDLAHAFSRRDADEGGRGV